MAVIHDIRLKELRLFTDAGRSARPLFIVDSQRLNIKKGDIVKLQGREEDERLTEQKLADDQREDDEPVMYGWQSLIRRVRGHAVRSCCRCGGDAGRLDSWRLRLGVACQESESCCWADCRCLRGAWSQGLVPNSLQQSKNPPAVLPVLPRCLYPRQSSNPHTLNSPSQGFIEYIDAEEEETTMIAMTIRDLESARMNPDTAYSSSYTHCEIHPSMILVRAEQRSRPRHVLLLDLSCHHRAARVCTAALHWDLTGLAGNVMLLAVSAAAAAFSSSSRTSH